MKYQDKLDMVQETIWNVLGVFRLTPWIQDIFYFVVGDLCLLAALRKKTINRFSLRFQDSLDMAQSTILAWLFHG